MLVFSSFLTFLCYFVYPTVTARPDRWTPSDFHTTSGLMWRRTIHINKWYSPKRWLSVDSWLIKRSRGGRSRTCYHLGYEPCMVIPFHSPAKAGWRMCALLWWLQVTCIAIYAYPAYGSDNRDRTCGFFLVREALSQLSYIGMDRTGIEPAISSLQNSRHPIATSGPSRRKPCLWPPALLSCFAFRSKEVPAFSLLKAPCRCCPDFLSLEG